MFEVDQLIQLVKARPPLYNSALLEYKSKPICGILWTEIAHIMNKDATQCRTVWTSLRSSYARHLQNMENNKKGINQRKKAQWYLADKMSFLNDHMLRTPQDRCLTNNTNEEQNNSTTSVDDNSVSYFEYKSDNCTMDDNHSIVTIKSEDLSELTLSSHEEIFNKYNNYDVRENVIEVPEDPNPTNPNYSMKRCRVELTSKDQNILTPKRNIFENVAPKVSVAKRFRMSPDEPNLMARKEILNCKAREESTLMFFQSILFDLRKLSDRKLRFFKQDILQDLNKYLDEDENED